MKEKWIILLRGINVGGRNRLEMKQLSRHLEDLGCSEVRTYIASGNAIVTPPPLPRDDFADRLKREIESSSSTTPEVLILSADELTEAVSRNPFTDADAHPTTVHLYCLSAPPGADAASRLDQLKAATESFLLLDRFLFLHAPDGIGKSALVRGLEGALRASATGRNWRTIGKLLELAREH